MSSFVKSKLKTKHCNIYETNIKDLISFDIREMTMTGGDEVGGGNMLILHFSRVYIMCTAIQQLVSVQFMHEKLNLHQFERL